MSGDLIMLAHGGGGELTRRLIAEHIRPRLANPALVSNSCGGSVFIQVRVYR